MISKCLFQLTTTGLLSLTVSTNTTAAILHVPSGSTRNISGTHVFDDILIEGRLNLSGSTTLVSRSSFQVIDGEIWGIGGNGSDGNDGTIFTPPTDGTNGGTGRTLVVRADGDINLLSGRIDLRGGPGGFGGTASLLSNHYGGDGGRGGNAGNLSLFGQSISFDDFLINLKGGDGGNAGRGGTFGLIGWGGDAGDGGDLLVDYAVKGLGLPDSAYDQERGLYSSGGFPGRYVPTPAERDLVDEPDYIHEGDYGSYGQFTLVPEPASAMVLTAGVSLLAMRRRRVPTSA